MEDQNGNMWVATPAGVYIFNSLTASVTHISEETGLTLANTTLEMLGSADKIEIETQQDLNLSDSPSYQIEISDYKQQFRITALEKRTFPIGTKIIVYVNNNTR